MRPYYTDYASRALRCWARGISPDNEADVLARQGVLRALSAFNDRDERVILAIYGSRYPFVRALTTYASLHGVPEGILWNLARDIERRVAKECGIL